MTLIDSTQLDVAGTFVLGALALTLVLALFDWLLPRNPSMSDHDTAGRRLVSSTEFQECDWEDAADMVDAALTAAVEAERARVFDLCEEIAQKDARIANAIAALKQKDA